ncbi:MAG: ABC transporter permease [Pseudomonadales bacterium]
MLHPLLTLIRKEFLSYFRDPLTRGILIGPPLLQLVVFSSAATLEVSNVNIAILNEDSGRWSSELIARIDASSFVNELIYVDSSTELTGMIDRSEILMGIHYPSDFSRDVVAKTPASLQVILDGRRANAAQVAFGYVSTVAGDLGIELRESVEGLPPQTAVRHWFNPNLDYQWFIVPSLAAMLAMMISIIVTSLSIARERELGTFDQLLVSPISPLQIIIGKSVPPMLIGAALSTVMVLAAILLFRVPFSGSFLLLIGSLFLFVLSVVGLGLSISSVCGTQQQAILGAFAIVVPIILTSGFATPVENMPEWLQLVAEANPLKHFLIIVQGSFLKAPPVGVVAANAIPLALIAAVTLSMATFFVRGRLQ